MKIIRTFNLGCGATLSLKTFGVRGFLALITQETGEGGIAKVPGVDEWRQKVQLFFNREAIPGLREVLDAAERAK